jgi:hypothetical protein
VDIDAGRDLRKRAVLPATLRLFLAGRRRDIGDQRVDRVNGPFAITLFEFDLRGRLDVFGSELRTRQHPSTASSNYLAMEQRGGAAVRDRCRLISFAISSPRCGWFNGVSRCKVTAPATYSLEHDALTGFGGGKRLRQEGRRDLRRERMHEADRTPLATASIRVSARAQITFGVGRKATMSRARCISGFRRTAGSWLQLAVRSLLGRQSMSIWLGVKC